MEFTYKWNLKDLEKVVTKNGYKVFSCLCFI